MNRNNNKIINASLIGGIAGIALTITGVALSVVWAWHHKIKVVKLLLNSIKFKKLFQERLMELENKIP